MFTRYLILLTSVSLCLLSCIIKSNPQYYTASDDYHIITKGETLSSISREYGIPVEKLMLFNNLSSDRIFPGQKLYLKPRIRQKQEYVTVRPIPACGYHTVRSKESITRIAKMYDLSLIEIMDINNLKSFNLETGQKIYLKSGKITSKTMEAEKIQIKPVPDSKDRDLNEEAEKKSLEFQKIERVKNTELVLPLKGIVTSEFGIRNGKPHKGIDIESQIGTPILAAMKGRVAYVGTQRGYGNVIILEHDNFIMTVYAHNETNLVREGDEVAAGQPIATVGDTGTATGPHLHFEYRLNGVAVNPRELFPDF